MSEELTGRRLFERLVRGASGSPEEILAYICRKLQENTDLEIPDDDFDLYAERFLVNYLRKFSISISYPLDASPLQRVIHIVNAVIERDTDQRLERDVEDLLDIVEDTIEGEGHDALTAEEKLFILDRIGSIKERILSSGLKPAKIEAIMKKLHKLELEVESDRTNADVFFGFLMDASLVAGRMAENTKPFMDDVKDILRIVMRVKARSAGVDLPEPEVWPQLPGPGEFGGK